ncbi:hypothetical protein ACFS32_24920 [Novosphingobium pokkalii]|uniref:hypothetical protein n=1 Tax=Novosphingobium pokkalii TaxID=1770194 RepID=UPI0036386406
MRALSFAFGLSLTLSPAMAQPADSARAALVRLGLPAQGWDLRVERADQPSYRVTVHHGRIAARGSSPSRWSMAWRRCCNARVASR